MRKTRLKSLYHWFIMSLVMGMPLILTILSSIPNAYNENNVIKYEKVEYNPVTSLVGNTWYHCELDGQIIVTHDNSIWCSEITNLVMESYDSISVYNNDAFALLVNSSSTRLYVGDSSKSWYLNPKCSFDFKFAWTDDTYEDLLPYVYSIDNINTYVVNNSAYQVWQFNQKFLGMPINSWYHDLIGMTIGVPSDYSPMNNLIVFPLYGVWVLLFDLVFDCIAFIPNVCHHWLEKLGGENE